MLKKVSGIAALVAVLGLNGCALVIVADAAVAVAATTVKAGAEVVGAAAHATAQGIKAVTKSDEKKPEKKEGS